MSLWAGLHGCILLQKQQNLHLSSVIPNKYCLVMVTVIKHLFPRKRRY